MSVRKFFVFLTGTLALFLFFGAEAFAQDTTVDAAATALGWKYLAAGLAVSLAALGGGMGQGRATHGVVEAISRNPSSRKDVFTPFIIGLALIESLVIYGLLVSILLLFVV